MNNKLSTGKYYTESTDNNSVFYPLINFKNRVIKKRYNRPIILENNQILETEKVSFINKPLIIKKKKSPIKTLRYINNDTGKMRHFTPGAQE